MNLRHIVLTLFTVSLVLGQDNGGIDFPKLGKVQPRSSYEIASSNWSIGAETMDRDLVEFESWKDHLSATGAKKVRLQAGWAKCEPKKGAYNFEWLDEIIDHVIAQDVEPWLQTSYGNPIYKGGGGIHLSAGIPTSEEALKAWDNWVGAMAMRYQGKVKFWEVWNEPDNKGKTSPEAYAALYIRTAEIIRSHIPDAQLFALSLAGNSPDYVDAFLKTLKGKGKLHLVNDITLHGYTYNPSDTYKRYEQVDKVIKKYSNDIQIRQGELGCPSENQPIMALKNYDWTELSQAKWAIRKMMGDLGRDIPSSYFLIMDIVYTHDHEKLMDKPKRNTKGLIKSDLERNFVAFKQAFYAYQNVTSIFDDSLKRIPNYGYTVDSDESLSVFAYQNAHFNEQVIAVWKDNETPTNVNTKTPMNFEFPQGNFGFPVYVELRTGNVYEIPKSNWKKNGTHFTFKNIPVYDSPILIAAKSLIPINENKE